MPSAPSPPAPRHLRRSSSLEYVDVPAGASAGKGGMRDAHPRSSRRRRQESDAESEALEGAAPAEDYDMYDNDGMRVRVREI